MLMEDAAPLTLNARADLPRHANQLYDVGDDIALLAAAMKVLVRRAERKA